MQWLVLKNDELKEIYSIPLPNVAFVTKLENGQSVVSMVSGHQVQGVIVEVPEVKKK